MKRIFALMLFGSFLMFSFAQNSSLNEMSGKELQFHQNLLKMKDAQLPKILVVPNNNRGANAQGDDCTDPFNYGNVDDPAQSGSIVSYGADWYSFTMPYDGTVTVSLCGSDYDTRLDIWNDCSDAGYT